MFGMGMPELLLIMVLALLIFGPKKLPELAHTLGKAVRDFQHASEEVTQELKRDLPDKL